MRIFQVFYNYYENGEEFDSSIVIHESKEQAETLIKKEYANHLDRFKITNCIEYDLDSPKILD